MSCLIFFSRSINGIVLTNCFLMIFWHLVVLFACRALPNTFFDCTRFLYRHRKWERDGKFYVRWLKIKKWKDYLPQYVATDGFSKRELKTLKKIDREYVGLFVTETCRAEWNHYICSFYFVISIFINTWPYSLIFSIIPIIVNVPFLLIQRYNRLRLLKFGKKL